MKQRRDRLIRMRKAAGYTQEGFAELLGVDRSTVVRWERAQTEPQPWLRRRLARVLSLSAEQLDQALTQITTVETTSPSPADGWHGATAPHGTPLNLTAIGALSATLRTADRQLGGGMLYACVVHYLSVEIGPRLVDASGPTDAALFSAACSLTELAGWMAHDSGDDTAAQRHFQRAYRLACAAENDALAANVCASMSHLAGQLHQPANAVRIADAGIHRATHRPGTAQLLARLHAMRARGLAASSNPHDALAALRSAEQSLAATADAPAPWLASFDEAALAHESALCLYQLGDLSGAKRHAERVVALRTGDRVRSRAFGLLALATVLAQSRRVDEAAAVGSQLSQTAASLTSTRVRSRLCQLADALRPHAAVPEVDAFLHTLPTVASNTGPDSAWPV